ncbi:MAG: choice-of-anchor D domain-containing protein, partial [Thiotrichales bacterium]|nr:choice-of-anchor D domain-containing protein [Thiotrichales bacterium]
MGLRLFSLAMLILTSFAVTSCGGGGGSNSSNNLPQESTVTIQGSGIKGILANATVSIYELNTSLALSYDPAFPIAIGVTNSVGMSASLEIPTNISRPLVLVVDGASSIDLNSNQVPVITKLTSIFTIEDALAGNPIFATPYTTIAHEMAKSNSTSSASDAAFRNNFASAVTDVGAALGFGIADSVNFLTTPAVLTENMASQAQQAAIIQHRAAIEALAAVIVELRTASGNTLSSADVVLKLAEDLFNDGLIDGDSGLDIAAIPVNVENLYVPGTQVQIKDIGIILESDRQYTGVNTNSVRSLSPILARPTLSSGSGSSTDNNSGSGGNSTETPAPVIFFSASNVNFGSIAVGSSATNSITLTNIGSASLTIASMTIAGDFSQTNACSGYVPSGQSCTINVTFTPVSSGNRSGLLSISGNMTATRTVSLLGVGDSGTSSANTVLNADFERLSRGAYRESDLRSDFNVNSWRSNGLSEFSRYRNETVH